MFYLGKMNLFAYTYNMKQIKYKINTSNMMYNKEAV